MDEDRGHKLFTNNFYTNPPLYKKLKEKNIGACGTVLDNAQGYPQQLKMKIGDPPVFAKWQDLLVAIFHDSKRLSNLTSVGDNSTQIKRIRDRKSPGGFRNILKPTIAQNYNNHMAGVDHFDQLKGNYNYPHQVVHHNSTAVAPAPNL
ncbi:PiggyBac transposable element-derived protein 4-like [Plakobranchus ocellatus]|uniref:PiggyBac transposable element-derived protein 4-like n=1 Tax=Plakobranchus ocellatus TaxID=259542 RepID=A0AAV4AAW7_9GAST|nr:PiggyBac transposable element-derived protein 4-like [Plakobranchus ocellatus]